ncbi:MAG: ABC transporter permease [Bacilli bacterium]|nr:ABC transporter permease [Bacilli bacterium]
MFYHNFKYTLKILIKNKSLIFWTLLFPIILGTLFKLTFMNIEKNETAKEINIAIIDNQSFQDNIFLKETFESLSSDSSNKILNITYTNLEKANELLNTKEIIGYFEIQENPKIVILENGINETIFKNVVLEILETKKMFDLIIDEKIQEDPTKDILILNDEVINKLNQKEFNIKDITKKSLSYTMIEFYTLIAMTCLYGGLLGIFILKQILPNLSSKGKRISISKVSKNIILFSSILATYLMQIICLIILFLYTIFILKINFSSNLFLIILITLTGSFSGLSLGIFIGTIKKNENFQTGVLITLTMLGCFLSGMMGVSMKYIIDKNIPILNRLNPVNMITDAMYSLYYYDSLNRYFLNLISLIILSIILITLSIKKLRRVTYDSI